MTSVEVIFTGIIMLLRGSVMGIEPSNALRASIAIEDLGPKRGTYGVMIPRHETRRVVAKSDATKNIDDEKRVRVLTAEPIQDAEGNVLEPAKDFFVVALKGDRVQFGIWNGSSCTPIPVATTGAGTAALDMPNLKDLVTDARLVADALPKGSDYSGISPSRVAAWLDLHGGSVQPNRHPNGGMSDFRPTRVTAELPDTVSWMFSGSDLCVAITPFAALRPNVVFSIKSAQTTIGYQNAPVEDLTDVHPGTSFDYELFYDVLRTKPCPPPLPHISVTRLMQVPPQGLTIPNDELRRLRPVRLHPHGDDESGENCGPINNNGGCTPPC